MTFTVTVTLYGRSKTWTGLTESQANRLRDEAGSKPDASVTITEEEAA